jgi:hypothetical protein
MTGRPDTFRSVLRITAGQVRDHYRIPVILGRRGPQYLSAVVAIELSIPGHLPRAFETPADVIWPTGAKLDIPAADFWYMRDGKIQEFNCHIGTSAMFAQLGVLPDFTSAVGVRARTITPTGNLRQRRRAAGRTAARRRSQLSRSHHLPRIPGTTADGRAVGQPQAGAMRSTRVCRITRIR